MYFVIHNFIQNHLEMFTRMGLNQEDIDRLQAWGCICKLLDKGNLTELELQPLEDDFEDEEDEEEIDDVTGEIHE